MRAMSDALPHRAAGPRPIAWADGRVLPVTEATVPLTDPAFLWGDAVMAVVPVRDGRTHALDAHLVPLRTSARELAIRVPVLRRTVVDLLAAWGERDGALRLVVGRGGLLRGVVWAPDEAGSISLETVDLPWRRPLAGLATVARAAEQWARRQAVAAHADDALVVDGDTVMELPTSAVCVVAGGRIRTPDPHRHPVRPAVTVTELARVADVEHATVTRDELDRADEVFVASPTRLLQPVHAIGDREYPAPGPVTRELAERFAAHVRAHLDPLP
jgi:branched-chain amino acid aminotransferase